MPTEFVYSTDPHPIKPNKKYRDDDANFIPNLNIMADPRVVRGSTFANAKTLALARKNDGKMTRTKIGCYEKFHA
jgi:hypothetical protein